MPLLRRSDAIDPPVSQSTTLPLRSRGAGLVALLLLVLVGCGGGGGGGGGTPPAAPVAPSGLDYVIPPAFTVGVALTPLTPTLTAGNADSFAITPALPAGLTFDAATGTIDGTPSAALALTTFTITASNATGSTTFDLPLEVLAAVIPEIAFTVASQSALESAGTVTVDLALSLATTVDISIAISDLSTSATLGADYQINTTTFSIVAGQTGATFDVDLLDDTIDENDESIELALSSPTGVTIGAQGTQSITILDDEANPVAQFTTATLMVAEDAPSLSIDVQFDRAASTARTVTLAASGSAQGGSDFTIGGATLTFLPGDVLGTMTIDLIDDAIFEGDEQLTLTLIPGTEVQAGPLTTLTITIGENDPPPSAELTGGGLFPEGGGAATLTVTLSDLAAVDATIEFVITGSATAGVDFTATTGPLTIPAGTLTTTISVEPLTDTVIEGTETVEVALISATPATLGLVTAQTVEIDDVAVTLPTVEISGDATVLEGAGLVNLTVQLSAPSTQPVLVDYQITGSATPGVDFAAPANPVTIPAGVISVPITIEPIDDGIVEGTETATLTLTGATGATLGTNLSATATIEETPAITVTLAGGGTILETDSPIDLLVSLSAAAPTAVDVFFSLGGTATNGIDYQITPMSPLTIPAGDTIGIITIDPIDDGTPEGFESIDIDLTSATGATLGAMTSATIGLDEINLPAVNLTGSGQSQLEGAGPISVGVELTTPTTQNVFVTFGFAGTATPGTDFLPTISPVAIIAGTTATTITIDPLADGVTEGNETVEVLILSVNGAAIGAMDSALVTIEDDTSSPTAPMGLSYSEPVAVYAPGATITPNVPTLAVGSSDDYSVIPLLPPGLMIDPTTGIITGAPLFEQANNQYTITASNSFGSTSTTILIGVGTSFRYEMPSLAVPYNMVTGAASFTLPLTVEELVGGPTPTFAEISGISAGISFDPQALVITSVAVGSALSSMNGGNGPDFYVSTPIGSGGRTFGIIFSFSQNETLVASAASEWAAVSFQSVPSYLQGDPDGETVSIVWDGTLGTPPVENVLVYDNQLEQTPDLIDAGIDFVP